MSHFSRCFTSEGAYICIMGGKTATEYSPGAAPLLSPNALADVGVVHVNIKLLAVIYLNSVIVYKCIGL
jgi:hypothetical protein